jgi:4-alpha-glucanotransferase
MKILQLAFGGDPKDLFLPHNYTRDCVVYTGSHDNDTTMGWYQVTSSEKERDYARRYVASNGSDIAWDFIRLAWSSVANTAMTTTQDLLSLGHQTRMNLPGTAGAPNWCWRVLPGALTPQIAERLRELTYVYGRIPSKS